MLATGLTFGVQAQNVPICFINKQQVNPQSLDFLLPKDIGSIQILKGDEASLYLNRKIGPDDSIVVVQMKPGSKLLQFDELLKRFYIDKSAKTLPVKATPNYYKDGFINPTAFVVSSDLVYGVSVHLTNDLNQKGIYIHQLYRHWDKNSKIENAIHSITSLLYKPLI